MQHNEKSNLELWFDKPAEEWTEALPVGCGRLGAMVYGRTDIEQLQLNEDTIWKGKPHDYTHQGAKKYLPEIRKLLFAGKQKEAEELAAEKFMSIPLEQKPYQPFCDFLLEIGHQKEDIKNYRRSLDLNKAVTLVTYKHQGIKYKREVFASHPAQAIIIKIEADEPGALDFSCEFVCPHDNFTREKAGKNQLSLNGKVAKEGIGFCGRALIENKGGKLAVTSQKAVIEKADSVIIKIVGASSFNNYRDISGDPAARCQKMIKNIDKDDYNRLKKEHIKDYQKYFKRVSLNLQNRSKQDNKIDFCEIPTDERIKGYKENNDPQLAVLYYQFGRYLMISGSRPGTQPLNLQGIWNKELDPPWGSKYTTNINLEMNYWPAELTNLSEMHLPLFKLIEEVSETGTLVAREHYNCQGWVLHHNTDLWRGAAPINNSNHGIWPTGGAWLCQHLWQHYEFNSDQEFLKERAYPVMKKAAEFFVDFLVEDPESGFLISTPSNSPEQGGLVAGPAMDHQIIRNLFSNCIKAGKILNIDQEFTDKLSALIDKIAPAQIGQYGQLQEWLQDKDDPENEHRHVSHMWGLHPGYEITPVNTPQLAEDAGRSLEFRGDGGTGWSKAWKINFWARLLEGDHAYKLFQELITTGTYPNLFDSHPPFQIDGNFGGVSGITEMLIQSHEGQRGERIIRVLPALPAAWPEGEVVGLKTRGNFEIGLTWSEMKAVKVRIKSFSGGQCKLALENKDEYEITDNQGNLVKVDKLKEDLIQFDTEPGESYDILHVGD